jgi:lipopolysaccharide/colanic/teichoic acid biosynthesis glycosyltransferase
LKATRVIDYRRVKRLLDVVIAGSALVLLSPVLGGIAVMIRLAGGGPALYRSARAGANGRSFEMLKFRTMTTGAPDLRNPDGSTYSASDDSRVTPLGRWLRRTSLDELPQLLNVLNGDMSLVGPRPELPDQISQYTAADRRRLDVRPGITGLAQVRGRNALTWQQRRALDVEYVNSMTFSGDVVLLLRTLPSVLGGRGVFGNNGSSARPGTSGES